MRISAWLLSHDCATKTASNPNTTAKAIMTMVVARTALFLKFGADVSACSSDAISGVAVVLNW